MKRSLFALLSYLGVEHISCWMLEGLEIPIRCRVWNLKSLADVFGCWVWTLSQIFILVERCAQEVWLVFATLPEGLMSPWHCVTGIFTERERELILIGGPKFLDYILSDGMTWVLLRLSLVRMTGSTWDGWSWMAKLNCFSIRGDLMRFHEILQDGRRPEMGLNRLWMASYIGNWGYFNPINGVITLLLTGRGHLDLFGKHQELYCSNASVRLQMEDILRKGHQSVATEGQHVLWKWNAVNSWGIG